MSNYLVSTEEYKGLTIEIHQDEDAQNPLIDWDNASVFACWHRDYHLGHYKDTEGHNVESYLRSILSDDALACIERFEKRRTKELGYNYEAEATELLAALGNEALVRPLFLYDHSGITMSAAPFSCPWDSGQVGFQYITHDKIKAEWGGKTINKKNTAKAIACMDGELKCYDDYLTGQVYGYVIKDADDNDLDSCWGFIGDMDYCLEQAKEQADYHADKRDEQSARDLEASRPDMYASAE